MFYPYRTDTKPRAVWPAHLEHLTMAPTYTWFSSSGRITLTFANLDQCRQCAHPGPCDLDVADLSTDPAIAAQLAAIDAADLARELKDYGAWDETELADHAQNLQRVLWLAACDVHETPADHLDGVTA